MENTNIKGWRKTIHSVRRLYHTLNNYRMTSIDYYFKEFSLLEYEKILPEEIKDRKQPQYIKQLELAKKEHIKKDLKVFLASSKQKERFINQGHKTVPIGNKRVMESENLITLVQFGYNSANETFCTAYRIHENIPLLKPYT